MTSLLSGFERVNSKGYINYTEISKLPVINDLYTSILNPVFLSEGITTNKLENLIKGLGIEGYEVLVKWSYNLLILHLLVFTQTLISKSGGSNSPPAAAAAAAAATSVLEAEPSEQADPTEPVEPTMLTDLNQLEKELCGMLDSMLRLKTRKQGITLTQNIYCGFDSEYKKIDMRFNRLLSVQLALSTQSTLKLPLNPEFNFGYKSKSGEIIHEQGSKILDIEKVLGEIRRGIKTYRTLKFGGHDDSLTRLIIGIKESGKSYITDQEFMHVIYTNTRVKQYFNRLESYSLKKLVEKSLELVGSDLEDSAERIFEELKNLFETALATNPGESLDTLTELLDPCTQNLDKIPSVVDLARETLYEDETVESAASPTPTVSNLRKSKKGNRRTWMTSFTSERVSVSIKKQLYLLIHNSAADLSILSDFNDFKESLDLVNKCFVTLSDPIKVGGIDVKIRDTQLLSPGGSKSLHSLSKLYPSVEKIKISYSDITDMESF